MRVKCLGIFPEFGVMVESPVVYEDRCALWYIVATYREKERDLTQSYDKSPTENIKAIDNTKTQPKPSITQQLRAYLDDQLE